MSWRYRESSYSQWAPYVPVAQRKKRGAAKAKKRLGKGESLAPIKISGRKIATTFWGVQWCEYMEGYSDYANRIPRGRTYARNGSIAHLRIKSGEITAMVCGSDLYSITIKIKKLPTKRWKQLCSQCASSIHSVIDLMRGKLSDRVIERLTDPDQGMFPKGREISMHCDCPDGALLCKHLAAVLYGVGNRLDSSPELLFTLRGVNQTDLIAESLASNHLSDSIGIDEGSSLDSGDLESIFGIDLAPTAKAKTLTKRNVKRKSVKKKVVKRKVAAKKAVTKRAVKKQVKRKAVKKKAVKRKVVKKKAAAKKTASKRAVKKQVKRKAVKKKAIKRKVVKGKAAVKKTTIKKAAKKQVERKAVKKKAVKKKVVKRKVTAKKTAIKKATVRGSRS